MIIFDLGCCVGLFTDYCLEEFSDVTVYCFEPFSFNYEHLKEKYKNSKNIFVFNCAISNTEGTARFYKKVKPDKRGSDFAGNAGCSLKKNKTNVNVSRFEDVKVRKISNIIKEENVKNIDLMKVDTEGSEYEIFQDIIDNNLHEHIEKIYYEDHCRKIPGLEKSKKAFHEKVKKLNIQDKFYLQDENGNHLNYKPIAI